jgi:hypothetical protein
LVPFIINTFTISRSSGGDGGYNMDVDSHMDGSHIDGNVVDNSAQADHDHNHDQYDHADDLAAVHPIVEFVEHLVDSFESPFLRI